MKLQKLLLLLLLPAGLFVSCQKEGPTGPKGEQGEPGEQGQTGPQGPQGIEGNANVIQYIFGEHDFSINGNASLNVPDVSEEEMNQSAWFVYLVRYSGNVYPIPGWGLDGDSEYRLYWSYVLGAVRFNIQKVSGPGEEYEEIRIIQVLANQTKPLSEKVELPDINFNNYGEVIRYYGLSN